jgi:ornithine cyclodeaminase/alanine dehydrogenase-like protein (mu-crystallin family)
MRLESILYLKTSTQLYTNSVPCPSTHLVLHRGVIDESHIFGELADIVSGKKVPRTSNNQITLFKGLGLAIEDIVSVKYVYDEAQKEGLTSFIELGHSQAAH